MRALLMASLVLGLATAAMAQTADLKVGDQAPNFKLQATDGKTYQQMAGSMTGMTEEESRNMMINGGRSIEGNRSRKEQIGKDES